MDKREPLLERLVEQISRNDFSGSAETCFRILYRVPAELQLELTRVAILGYMPVFQKKWPKVNWPDELLKDVDAWLSKYLRALPNRPAFKDPADLAFKFCFDALLMATNYKSDPAVLTSSCVSAITSAIKAQMTDQWIFDDPEAYKRWRKHEYIHGRSLKNNPRAIAFAGNEWCKIAGWLLVKDVVNLMDTVHEQELEQVILLWKSREGLPLSPVAS